MITLYRNDMSSCAQKVRFALAEKGLEWEGIHLNLRGGDQHQPDYMKLNPAGVVSSGIAFRYQKLAKGREAAAKLVDAIPDEAKRERMRSITFDGTSAPLFAAAILQFRKLVADIETALESHDWLAGDAFSLADMVYAPSATRLDHLQLSGMWHPESRFAGWYARIREKSGYRTGIADWFNDAYLELMAKKGAEAWPQVQDILRS